jgi:ATP-dependent Lhr-like helicase
VSSGLLDGITVPADPPDVTDPRTARQFAGEILSFYGPLSLSEIKEILPTLPAGLLDDVSAPDDTSMVSGVLVEGREEACYCNSENLEILLRFQRSRNRPEVTPRKAETLPAFLAAWQRFGRGASEDSIIDALLCLRGYPAPVDTWLAEFMSARMTDFSDYQLDQAVAAGELCWYGVDRETVSFGYPEDPDLLAGPDTASPVAALFTDPHARYGFLQLADRQQESLESFNGTFWDAVWQGELVCDSLASLREGATGKYQLLQMPSRTHSARSARRASSRLGSGWGGNWSLRAPAAQAEDALMELEDNKDRARLLLDRYGFACRELANREGRSMRWAAICKALFSMELAGEIVAGYFFEGLSGPQFMTPAGLNTFLNTRSDLSFWVNAVDPVSPCGLGVDDPRLPARRPGNYLSYHEGELALVVENAGHRLSFHLPHDHPAVDGVCAPLMHIVRTRKRFPVDTINGLAPASSPYLAVLSRVFTPVRDHRRVFFERR